MQQPQFGKKPDGQRLRLIQDTPNFKSGQFENENFTPMMEEGYFAAFRDFLFNKSKRNQPSSPIPTRKTDLKNLNPAENVLVWFGHSSYFLQVDGKKILIDPVFSGSASPVKFTTRSFKGSDAYSPDDFPDIDYLFISHDHWDHLDYETIVKIRAKIKKVITGLGTGAHLEFWGYDPAIIIEKNWNEKVKLDDGFFVHTAPARHFSGRTFSRNKAVWLSFILITPTLKLYLGGDSGYDTHFARIGQEHGPFDLVILECGQYNKYWKYIHMMPEETVQAAIDLKAKKLLPVHWAKFALAPHAWDDPIIRVTQEARKHSLPALHPMIGETINLNGNVNSSAWWEKVA